jgi:DNA-binding FadR family transcriptional regulator
MFSRPPGLAQRLASEIEELITARGLRSGDRITTMEELREQTGYGRATIVETFRLLAERGSAEVRPGRGGGLFAAEAGPAVRLRQTLLTVPHGASTVADAIAVRDSLEELIALEAAAHRSDQDILDLQVRLELMRRSSGDLEDFLRANWSLHERIAAITPNDLARALYVALLRCIAELSVHAESESSAASAEYLAERLAVHEQLVEAIRLGEAKLIKAAVAAHRGDGADGVVDGCFGPGPAPAETTVLPSLALPGLPASVARDAAAPPARAKTAAAARKPRTARTTPRPAAGGAAPGKGA